MQLAALDILITKGRFAPESARAIGEAVDLELERSRNPLATSQQLADARQDMRKEWADTRLALEQRITKVEHRIEEVRLELLAKIEAVKSEILRWMFLAMTGQTVVLVGLIRLLR
jgi:chromatin segregation and condensation protein Rec8/ScpA/Scc1 (kleisin family)